MIVAIDGPGGSGKGTVAKDIAIKIDAVYIDTGAMYRCVTLEALRENIKIDEIAKIQKLLDYIKIDLKQENDELKVYLNDEDVSKKIRTEEVSKNTSAYSSLSIIRKKMVKIQREMAILKDVVMEGRDIGTVVFPNADVKIYLDAKPEERAMRRFNQNIEKGIESNYDEILREIKARDYNDMTREISPLKKAVDAIYIDSTDLTLEEVTHKILEIIKNKSIRK